MEESWFEMLVESCGYIATFVGVMMEGEVSLATSVLGAKAGYFSLWPAIILAWLGAWIADWFKFLVAKKKGISLLAKKPKLKKKIDRLSVWYDRYPFVILLVYKLLFGMTTILLIITGLRDISYTKFAILSGISVAIWTGVIATLSFMFSESIISNLTWVTANIQYFLIGLAILAFLIWFFVKKPYRKNCFECDEDVPSMA